MAKTPTDPKPAPTEPDAPTGPAAAVPFVKPAPTELLVENANPGKMLVGDLWVMPGRHPYPAAEVEAIRDQLEATKNVTILAKA